MGEGGNEVRVLAVSTALAKDVTDEPHALARQLVAMMDGLQIQWLRAPQTNDLVQAWEDAANVLFADRDVGGVS